ncbi:MAG: hypothetical protein KDK07_19215 [Bauldia sp.]|nr:hypothetical protein [Bauldia sp.]
MISDPALGETLTVRVALVIAKRGGRRVVLVPDGAAKKLPHARPDSAMIKAVARAFRWRRQIEDGAISTIAEIATAERINPSYVSRVLRLSLLAPDIVDSILDGRQSTALHLDRLLKPFPSDWRAQRQTLCGHSAATAP